MGKLIVGRTGVEYAASKTTNTKNLALNPQDLREGAVGIYGVDNTYATYQGKTVLLVQDANGTGKRLFSEFKGEFINICFGTADGCEISAKIPVNSTEYTLLIREFEKSIAKAVCVGYNPIKNEGVLVLPFPLPAKGSTGIRFYEQPFNSMMNYEGVVNASYLASDNPYDISAKLVKKINDSLSYASKKQEFKADIVSGQTLLDVTLSTGAMVFVKGGAVVTISDTTNIAVGNYIAVHNNNTTNNASVPATNANSIVYKVVGLVASTSITLDRPYTGESQSIANVNIVANKWVKKFDTNPTVSIIGIRIIGKVYQNFEISVSDDLINSSITEFYNSRFGSGNNIQVKELEQFYQPDKGFSDRMGIANSVKPASKYVENSANYDLFYLDIKMKNTTDVIASFNNNVYDIVVAFVTGGNNTTGNNEKDFNDIITGLFPRFESDLVLTA